MVLQELNSRCRVVKTHAVMNCSSSMAEWDRRRSRLSEHVLVESLERKPPLRIIADSYRKAHGRRRMATAACPVARARRLDGCREFMLLVFARDGVPRWEVDRRA